MSLKYEPCSEPLHISVKHASAKMLGRHDHAEVRAVFDKSTLHSTPYTLHPTLCTLHPTPYTLHPTPYTLYPEF